MGIGSVAAEPDYGSDSGRSENEPVGVPQTRTRGGYLPQVTRQERPGGHSREIVIGQGRMAGVAPDQDLVLRVSRHHMLSIGEGAVPEGRVDENFIFSLRKGLQFRVGQAESPRFVVIGGAVGDPFRMAGKGM